MDDDILVVIISGKRPGDERARPTERLSTKHPRIIVSNNSDDYITTIPIVNVPEEYKKWYIENHKNSENAWFAPMNRSYAIKYAKELGYRYLVQLDDNIIQLQIAFRDAKKGRRFRAYITNKPNALDDFINAYKVTLENTNAAMVGCTLSGTAVPDIYLWREGYVYSLFMLDLERCPEIFHGDFEDDIEYRLKCAQMGRPVIQLPWLMYGKVGQGKNTDLSGCRAEYAKAGLMRGENMCKLYSETYTCKMTHKRHRTTAEEEQDAMYFKHQLKPIKVDVITSDKEAIRRCAIELFAKYKKKQEDKCVVKVRK